MVSLDVKKLISSARELLARSNVQLTILYAMCFGILGMVMSGMGPSLPELGRRTGKPDKEMGWILGVRAFGYLAGSMGGPLFDHLPGNYVLIAALTVCSVSCALVGFIRIYGLLFLVVPFQGICMGLLDTGGNVMTLWLHPKDPEPFMQSLHFAFAIGGLISPLLIGQVARHYAGSITASWVVIALCFIPPIILLFRYESPREPPRPVTEDGQAIQYVGWPLVVIFGTAAFLFFDIGAEASIATYLVTFAIRRGLCDEPTATLINSLFWVFMVIGRLIAIPVSTFVKSSTILIVSSILSLFATTLWFIFYKSFAVLSITMCLYGLGMSVAFATGVLLAQNYIPISGRAGTVFVVGAACGEFIIPISLSQLFPATNYMSLPMFMVGTSIVCLMLVFFIMWSGDQCPVTTDAPARKELDIVSIGDSTENSTAATSENQSESTSVTNDAEHQETHHETQHEGRRSFDRRVVRLDFDLG